MTDAHHQLIDDVTALTGAEPPAWADEQSPTLRADTEGSLYFIGVIGGKDVGKSSLINALLGEPLATVSSVGEGTHRVLAYVHRDDEAAVRTLLRAEIPNQFDLVTHSIDAARRRVLVDLPDVDSIWLQHVELTRRLLRHMLFPIWVQSIEKYADHQPMHLLAKVAAGNAPENFLFVLTKADLLAKRHGEAAVDELKQDYAARVARACQLDEPPAVYAISVRGEAQNAFDLNALRDRVLAARTADAVADALRLARAQQDRSLTQWLQQQRLDLQAEAAERLLSDAEALVDARLTEPLVDRTTEQLSRGTAGASKVIEPIIRQRLSYWPIVNVLDGILGPIVSAFRSPGGEGATTLLAGRDLDQQVRGVFAELSQRDPKVLTLYGQQKLWENDVAQQAASRLETAIEQAVEKHQRALLAKAARPAVLTRLAAPVLTIGAALWFPLIQPVAQVVASGNVGVFTREALLMVLQFLSAGYLLESVGLLAIYFIALWMLLRWRAYQRIDRLLRRAQGQEHPAAVVMEWSRELAAPLRAHVERFRDLQRRIEATLRPPSQAA